MISVVLMPFVIRTRQH